jgi:DNA polymerase III, gamma/tau subunits
MHHAVLYIGEKKQTNSHIESLFVELGIKTLGNPDIFLIETDVFSVEDARALSERSIEKAFGERKFFIIKAEKFTREAQNALLKTLEDPVPNTHFILSAREVGMFLPTIISRLHIEVVDGDSTEESDVKKFLKKTLKQRIDFAKKFADERDERGAGALAHFLDSLIYTLRESGASTQVLKKVLVLRTYARDTAVMPRLVLEHLALVV